MKHNQSKVEMKYGGTRPLPSKLNTTTKTDSLGTKQTNAMHEEFEFLLIRLGLAMILDTDRRDSRDENG